MPIIGPHNPALGEIYQRLYPEMRRPKPNQEAIAAALQAMQRLTMEADSETVAEDISPAKAALETSVNTHTACRVCGHQNREGNKFCGACGILLGTEPPEPSTQGSSAEPSRPPVVEEKLSAQLPPAPPAPRNEKEIHPAAGSPAGAHHYHHHYHHHYFQGAETEAGGSVARSNAPDSAREADRLRIAAAAKGEPMSRSEAAVRRLTQEWVLACNTRQLEELIELYAADALVLRSNLPPIRGAMAVREFFFASLEAGFGEVALDPMRVEVSGDLAHEVGRYSALVPGTAGKRREERGKYLWVFSKQSSGEWKLISESWSSDLTLSGAESDIPKAATPSAKTQPRRS
ncbi:MAG: signal peptide protein [Candidatus Sulfotelmatobacter sp.]|nr:signal peptide protein [Candidatus Sulfotelmatobacter sp.]